MVSQKNLDMCNSGKLLKREVLQDKANRSALKVEGGARLAWVL